MDIVIIFIHFPWEPLVKKTILISLLLLTLLSCSNVAEWMPANVPTLEALPSSIPTMAHQPVPSTAPTIEPPGSAVPEPEDILDPRGTPVQEWRGIPIMPDAIAASENSADNIYSFKANTTAREVQTFYSESLAALGWSQPFDNPFDEAGGTLVFRKEGSSLAITVTPSEDSVIVLLVMTLA